MMLHPAAASYENTRLKDNNRSCVLKIDSAGGSVLLPADIEARDEAALLARMPGQLPATLMVAPHHGSKTSSTPDFLAAVHPEITIFTVGYRNRYGHPRGDVVTRYAGMGGQLLRSDSHGAVEVRFAPGHAPGVAAWRQTRQRYWQAGVR